MIGATQYISPYVLLALFVVAVVFHAMAYRHLRPGYVRPFWVNAVAVPRAAYTQKGQRYRLVSEISGSLAVVLGLFEVVIREFKL